MKDLRSPGSKDQSMRLMVISIAGTAIEIVIEIAIGMRYSTNVQYESRFRLNTESGIVSFPFHRTFDSINDYSDNTKVQDSILNNAVLHDVIGTPLLPRKVKRNFSSHRLA